MVPEQQQAIAELRATVRHPVLAQQDAAKYVK